MTYLSAALPRGYGGEAGRLRLAAASSSLVSSRRSKVRSAQAALSSFRRSFRLRSLAPPLQTEPTLLGFGLVSSESKYAPVSPSIADGGAQTTHRRS